MTTKTQRNLGLGVCAAWLVVAGYGVWEVVESGDDWRLAYNIFALALAAGAALTLSLIAAVSRHSDRRGLRMAGLAVTGLGVAAAFVGAWALPLWMPILGVGFALVALASVGPVRRTLVVLVAAQFAGVAVQFSALGLGTDGDVASSVALIVTAATTIVGLASGVGYLVDGRPAEGPAAQRRVVAA